MTSEKDINPENKFELHWNNVYGRNEIDKLGWFEDSPVPSLQLIEKCNLTKDSHLLNVGAGATMLVDELLDIGYNNVIVNDLSSAALGKLKERLGEIRSEKVQWVVDDLTASNSLCKIDKVDLWHDRAVLHFFTKGNEQDAYFELLKKLVKNNGHVIIAAFNLESATKCSGLPIYRFDENLLQEKLGEDFKLVEAFNHTYTMPSGDTRKYIYTLFSRVA